MLEDVLNKYGQRFVNELSDAIKNKPLPRRGGKSYVANASGNLVSSLKYNVADGVLTVTGNKYIGALVYGRKPTTNTGTGELKNRIRTWIDDKGITPQGSISKDSLAFVIARKIHREGTLLYPQGSDLVSAIVTQDFINALKSDIFLELRGEIVDSINTIKKAA